MMSSQHDPQELNHQAVHTAATEPATEHAPQDASLYGESSYMPRSQFACLYTHHKTQKRKVWQDGRLVLQGSRAALHAAHSIPGSSDPVLDQCDISSSEASAIIAGRVSDLEMDKFLVTIDGPWVSNRNNLENNKLPNASASASMQKLLTKKYRKPAQQIPPPRSVGLQEQSRKRQRPLQPGELQKKYYGHLMPSGESNGDYRQNASSFQGPTGVTHSDTSSNGFQQANAPAMTRSEVPTQAIASRPIIRDSTSAPSDHNTFSSANPYLQPAEPQMILQQTITQQAKSSTNQSNEISDNSGYNPNSFYGEEEEEPDSDNESSLDLFQIPPIQGETDTFQTARAPKDSNLFQFPEQSEESNFFHIAEEENLFQIPGRVDPARSSRSVTSSISSNKIIPKQSSDTAGHSKSTLSTSQLLNLFGGADDPPDFSGPAPEGNSIMTQHVSPDTQPAIIRETSAIPRDEYNENDFQLPSDDSSDEEEE